MADQARKAAARQAEEAVAAAARDESAAMAASRAAMLATTRAEPGPSILKRKASDLVGGGDAHGAAAPAKRARMGVKFADQHGGQLTETQFFEVESLKTGTTKGYQSKKSHKEMMKRERELEKNDKLSKSRSSMQRTTDWTTPALLSLSVEVTENAHTPAVSAESEEQQRRLQHRLEVRYLDDSLIAQDPDDSAPDAAAVVAAGGDASLLAGQPGAGSAAVGVGVRVLMLSWESEGDALGKQLVGLQVRSPFSFSFSYSSLMSFPLSLSIALLLLFLRKPH